MEKDQLFGVRLPDPVAPFYKPTLALYVGTQEEILAFIDRLEESDDSCHYEDVIAAVRAYPVDSSASYRFAGRDYAAMIPVKELCRKEFSLSDHTWIHKLPNSSGEYLMRASHIWVSYILVEKEDACFATCCKAHFEELAVSMPGVGWVSFGVTSFGTPGLVYCETNNTSQSYMSLYRSEHWCAPDEEIPTVDSLPGPLSVDLSTAVGEVLGRR